MLSEIAIAACLAMGPSQCTTCGPGGGGMEFSPGMSSGSWTAGAGGGGNPYDAVASGGGGGGDQLYPFDSPEPWLHGWFQEIPAYGGYHTFRPHNYKHVIAQMEVAGRWGVSPVLPYSHQWYHPYRQRAGMHPDFGHQQASNEFNYPGMLSQPGGSGSVPVQTANLVPTQPEPEVRTVGAIQRGYTGTAIPGIAAPYYQVSAQSPNQGASQEYLERLDQLQKQIEQQTFQMQVLQEQLRNQPPSLATMPLWQQPNYAKFPEYQQPQPSAGYQGAPQGYQEVPLPPTGGPALQPAMPSMNGFGPAGAVVPNFNSPYAPAGAFGGASIGGPTNPFGASVPGIYQPGMQPGQPQPSFGQPNMGPLMTPAPATSQMGPFPGGGYFAPEGASPLINSGYGYPQQAVGGATHANYSYPPQQPTMAAPTNYGPSWGAQNAAPNQMQQYPNQGYNPGNAAPGSGVQPASASQPSSSGFRPFGRFLR